jgi:hypothetical protein
MEFRCRKQKHRRLDLYADFDTINNNMSDTQNSIPIPTQQPASRPNESTGLNIDEHIKISDPNTGTVILEQRA